MLSCICKHKITNKLKAFAIIFNAKTQIAILWKLHVPGRPHSFLKKQQRRRTNLIRAILSIIRCSYTLKLFTHRETEFISSSPSEIKLRSTNERKLLIGNSGVQRLITTRGRPSPTINEIYCCRNCLCDNSTSAVSIASRCQSAGENPFFES